MFIPNNLRPTPLIIVRLSNAFLAGIGVILPIVASEWERIIKDALVTGLEIPEPDGDIQALIAKEASVTYRNGSQARKEAIQAYRFCFIAVDHSSAQARFEDPDDFDEAIKAAVTVHRYEDAAAGDESPPIDVALTALARIALKVAINSAKLALQEKILKEDFRWSAGE